MADSIRSTVESAVPGLSSRYPSEFRAVVRALEVREANIGNAIITEASSLGYGSQARDILARATAPTPTVRQQAAQVQAAASTAQQALADVKSTLSALVARL